MCASPVGGDDYLIGYQLVTHNASVHYEKLSVSKPMMPCNGKRYLSLDLPRKPNETLHSILVHHENSFLEYASAQAVSVKSYQNMSNDAHTSQESLTLPVQCYAVDFNDDLVTITLLK